MLVGFKMYLLYLSCDADHLCLNHSPFKHMQAREHCMVELTHFASCKSVVETEELVQLALRYTLTIDALSLQLKLPPNGFPLPQPKSVSHVASGVQTVDITAVTSIWAVNLLRGLCQVGMLSSLTSLA